MFWWTIQTILFSTLFIFLAHHIFNTLTSTLTVTKVKDVVNSRNQKYDEICSIVSNNQNLNNSYNYNNNNNTNSYTLEDLLPTTEANTLTNANSMKNELKHFLKAQLNTQPKEEDEQQREQEGSTNISDLQPYSL